MVRHKFWDQHPEVQQTSLVYRAVTRLTFVQIVACSEANGRACAQIDAPGGARRAGEEIQVDLERGSSPGVPPSRHGSKWHASVMSRAKVDGLASFPSFSMSFRRCASFGGS